MKNRRLFKTEQRKIEICFCLPCTMQEGALESKTAINSVSLDSDQKHSIPVIPEG